MNWMITFSRKKNRSSPKCMVRHKIILFDTKCPLTWIGRPSVWGTVYNLTCRHKNAPNIKFRRLVHASYVIPSVRWLLIHYEGGDNSQWISMNMMAAIQLQHRFSERYAAVISVRVSWNCKFCGCLVDVCEAPSGSIKTRANDFSICPQPSDTSHTSPTQPIVFPVERYTRVRYWASTRFTDMNLSCFHHI